MDYDRCCNYLQQLDAAMLLLQSVIGKRASHGVDESDRDSSCDDQPQQVERYAKR